MEIDDKRKGKSTFGKLSNGDVFTWGDESGIRMKVDGNSSVCFKGVGSTYTSRDHEIVIKLNATLTLNP